MLLAHTPQHGLHLRDFASLRQWPHRYFHAKQSTLLLDLVAPLLVGLQCLGYVHLNKASLAHQQCVHVTHYASLSIEAATLNHCNARRPELIDRYQRDDVAH
jgi:hypothetical protein